MVMRSEYEASILIGHYSDPFHTNVSVQNCHISNSTDGIVSIKSDVNVSNTTINTNRYSLRPISSWVSVEDCSLQSDVFATNGGFFRIANSTIQGKISPLYLYGVDGVIENTRLSGEESGIILRNSQTTVRNVVMENLTRGLYLLSTNNVRAENLSAFNCT